MATVIGKDPSMMRRTTCWHCASIIEYSMNETTVRVTSDYTGDRESIRELTCPGCHKTITVKFH